MCPVRNVTHVSGRSTGQFRFLCSGHFSAGKHGVSSKRDFVVQMDRIAFRQENVGTALRRLPRQIASDRWQLNSPLACSPSVSDHSRWRGVAYACRSGNGACRGSNRADGLYFNPGNAAGPKYSIDTQSRGLLFTGQTVPTTMRAAAKATLDRGYTHFKFADASLQQGSVVAGTVGSSSTTFTGSSSTTMSGSYGGGMMNANASTDGSARATTFGTTQVVRAPTAAAAVTVIMFRANEPDARDAFDASRVLAQYMN
jgi:hypothetical protein